MGALVLGQDDGGSRWLLDGRPVHCGTGLRLRLPGNQWARVRFEVTHRPQPHTPVLYLHLGGRWEQRFEVQAASEGGFCLYDRALRRRVTLDARGEPDPGEEQGLLLYVDELPDKDRWTWKDTAEAAARDLAWRLGPEWQLCAVVSDPRRLELAWPDQLASRRGDLAGRVYVGERGGRVSVHYRQRSWELDPRLDLSRMSPTGFAWGWGGTRPSQLALALAADVLEDEAALKVHQELKSTLITPMDQHAGWVLVAEEVYQTCAALLLDGGGA